MKELVSWLGQGEFTKLDWIVDAALEDVSKLNGLPWEKIGTYLRKLKPGKHGVKEREFRRRSGSEILLSEYVNGCTDVALAFIVLARRMNIPTKYVETFNRTWLENPIFPIKGHVFVGFRNGEDWIKYDPLMGDVGEKYSIGNEEYVEAGEGIDFSELYVLNGVEFEENPIRVDTPEKIIALAKQISHNN